MDKKEWDEVMQVIRHTNKRLEYAQERRTYIPVTVRNENDWEYVAIHDGKTTRMAVF